MSKMNESQRDFLISFMETHPKLAKSSFDLSFDKQRAKKLWLELADRLNAMGGAYKNVKQWRRTWTDLKIATKKKAVNSKKEAMKTGGGLVETDSDEFDDTEAAAPVVPGTGAPESVAGPSSAGTHDRILSLIGRTAVEGMKGIKEIGIEQFLDSDSDSPDDPPMAQQPKRARLVLDNETYSGREPKTKQDVARQLLKNSTTKLEIAKQSADALSSLADSMAIIADCFVQYCQNRQ